MNTLNNAQNTTSTTRKAVKSIFGAKNARVKRNGEIHINGTMPNTNQTGWYLLGFVGSSEVNECLWYPDGSLKKG